MSRSSVSVCTHYFDNLKYCITNFRPGLAGQNWNHFLLPHDNKVPTMRPLISPWGGCSRGGAGWISLAIKVGAGYDNDLSETSKDSCITFGAVFLLLGTRSKIGQISTQVSCMCTVIWVKLFYSQLNPGGYYMTLYECWPGSASPQSETISNTLYLNKWNS